MILRVLQILIVLTWVGTTSVLLQRTFQSDESRLPEAELSEVLDQFFRAKEQGDLIVIKDETIVGRLSVTPRRTQGWGLDEESFPPDVREAFFSLRIDLNEEGPSLWSPFEGHGSFFLGTGGALHTFRLNVRMLKARISGQVAARLEPFLLNYLVQQDEQVLLDSRQPELAREWLDRARALGAMAGMDVSVLDTLGDEASMSRARDALLNELRPTVDCRRGRFRIFEGRYHGSILILEWGSEVRLRLYFSEFGELLKVDGIPNLLILGESFVPLRLFHEPGFDP